MSVQLLSGCVRLSVRTCCHIHICPSDWTPTALVKKMFSCKKFTSPNFFHGVIGSIFDDVTLSSSVRLFLPVVKVEVQHQQFGLLRPVPAAGGAHQPSVGCSDSPHNATCGERKEGRLIGLGSDIRGFGGGAVGMMAVLTWSSALQRHYVPQPGSGLQVPQFDRAVVGAGQDETSAELQARHGRLVLVGTWRWHHDAVSCDLITTFSVSFTS